MEGWNVPSSGIVGSFLAAFLVVIHPDTVFETRAEQEDSLYRSADRLLNIFDQVCSTISSQSGQPFFTISRELLVSYAQTSFEYVNLFHVWRNHDKSRLCERIYHSLRAITDALARLPTSRSEVTLERVQLLTQAKTLRGRLKRIAGAHALTSYDAEHPELVDDISITSESDLASFLEPMSNDQLAHEVLLDPSFRLQADVDGDEISTHGVRSGMQTAFWNGVEDDLRRMPPCYGRVLRVLVQVREGVAAVASPSITAALAETVDEKWIRLQAEKGLCDTQAPKRRAETEEGWSALKCEMDAAEAAAQPGLLCRGLQFLIARAKASRADVANERLMRLAPAILLHGVDYEREKFDAKLRSNALTLDQTRAWLACFRFGGGDPGLGASRSGATEVCRCGGAKALSGGSGSSSGGGDDGNHEGRDGILGRAGGGGGGGGGHDRGPDGDGTGSGPDDPCCVCLEPKWKAACVLCGGCRQSMHEGCVVACVCKGRDSCPLCRTPGLRALVGPAPALAAGGIPGG